MVRVARSLTAGFGVGAVLAGVLALSAITPAGAAEFSLPDLTRQLTSRERATSWALVDPASAGLPGVGFRIELATGRGQQAPDGSWTVPVGERVEWSMTWAVTNPSDRTLRGVACADLFQDGVEVISSTVEATAGEVVAIPLPGEQTLIEWHVAVLPAHATAELTFRLATRRRGGDSGDGEQMYSRPGDYLIDSGLLAWWIGGWRSFPSVVVHARDLPWLTVDVGPSRLDWRIRQPGRYAARALQFQVASNQSVRVTFTGFSDLLPLAGSAGAGDGEAAGSGIPAWYAAGESSPPDGGAGWWSATQLNEQVVHFEQSTTLRDVGLSYSLWQQLIVTEDRSPAEYEATGRVVFTLVNLDPAIIDG